MTALAALRPHKLVLQECASSSAFNSGSARGSLISKHSVRSWLPLDSLGVTTDPKGPAERDPPLQDSHKVGSLTNQASQVTSSTQGTRTQERHRSEVPAPTVSKPLLLRARPACVALDNASDLIGTDSGSDLVGDVVGSGDSVPQDQPNTTTAPTSTEQQQPASTNTSQHQPAPSSTSRPPRRVLSF